MCEQRKHGSVGAGAGNRPGYLTAVLGEIAGLTGDVLLASASDERTSPPEALDMATGTATDVTPPDLAQGVMTGDRTAFAAGRFLAVSQVAAQRESLALTSYLGLFDRASRTPVYVLRLRDNAFAPVGVTPDGRVVVAEQIPAVVAGSRYALHVIDLGAQPKLRLLTRELTGDSAAVVGEEAIVAVRAPGMGERPAAVPLGGGALRALGAPGPAIEGLDADAGSVAWRTRAGCIRRAALAEPAVAALPAGPCPRAAG